VLWSLALYNSDDDEMMPMVIGLAGAAIPRWWSC
jgi:hypothetical protein